MTGSAIRPRRRSPETPTAASPSGIDQTSPVTWRGELSALHRGERQQLRAIQAAGYAVLRRTGDNASAMAHAEVALAFAHRWAEVRRGPAALRAAAAASLQAEQAAALSARIIELVSRAHNLHRAQRGQLSSRYAADRRALSHRHRQAWAAAARHAVSRRPRPARSDSTAGRLGKGHSHTGPPQ